MTDDTTKSGPITVSNALLSILTREQQVRLWAELWRKEFRKRGSMPPVESFTFTKEPA